MITKVCCYFTAQLVPVEDAIPVVLKEESNRESFMVLASPNWEPRIPLSWISVEGNAVTITL